MGSGKTVFAQGLASALGVDPRQVQSPTFVLVREHEGAAGSLVHVDLYRLEDEAALASIGLDELLAREGVKVVEWAERLPAELQRGGRRFRFAVREDGSHTISELKD